MIVWLASYPRSGNTFFRLLLHALYGQETYSIYDDRELEQMGMASILGQRRRPGLESMRREGRIYFVKTHELPCDESPAIYFVRDGRDASVSYAHFLMEDERRGPGIHTRATWKLLGHSGFLRTLDGVVRDGFWQQQVLAWTADRPRGQTFVVRFEDLIKDPTYWLHAALNDIGIPLTPSGSVPFTFETLHERWPQFFRKGRVGSWREEMPDDIHEMFWRRGRAAMLRFGYDSFAPLALERVAPVRNGLPERDQSGIESQCQTTTANQNNADVRESRSVSMSCLGRDEDWGKSVFQYMFLKSFARQHEVIAKGPFWMGQKLFQKQPDLPVRQHPDVVVSDNISLLCEPSEPIGASVSGTADHSGDTAFPGKTVYALNDPLLDSGAALPFRHADLDGPFVLHSRMLVQHRDYLRGLLQATPEHEATLKAALRQLRARGKTIIAIHAAGGIGRLDVTDGAGVVPLSWYVKWLEGTWQRVDDPVLLLCTDDQPRALSVFAQFNPVTIQSLDVGTGGDRACDVVPAGRHSLTFIEWLLLTRCDVLAIANDLSSFAAAMMNTGASEFLRPSLEAFGLTHFDPWNDYPLFTLPSHLTLPGELAQRIRLLRASGGRRAFLTSLSQTPRLYAGILRRRLAICYRLLGARGLGHELVNPSFYLAARRAYGDSDSSTKRDKAERTGSIVKADRAEPAC